MFKHPSVSDPSLIPPTKSEEPGMAHVNGRTSPKCLGPEMPKYHWVGS